MRGTQLCYFHARIQRVTGRRRNPEKKPIEFPIIEDPAAIQLAVTEILDALADNNVDTRRASLMLRALQISAQLFRNRNNILPLLSVASVTQTADGEDLADDSTETGTTENSSEPEKRVRGNGLKQLQRAADQRLGLSSDSLADLLLERANEGQVWSAWLLAKLAERKIQRKPPEKKKKKRAGPSWAELLASEPEWVEEKPEVGDVWVGDGWKNEKTGRFVPAPR
jgi:hypothetical protein